MSTAITATVLSFSMYSRIILSIKLLFPAPEGPVIPILWAFPVFEYKSERISLIWDELFSAKEIIEDIFFTSRI